MSISDSIAIVSFLHLLCNNLIIFVTISLGLHQNRVAYCLMLELFHYPGKALSWLFVISFILLFVDKFFIPNLFFDATAITSQIFCILPITFFFLNLYNYHSIVLFFIDWFYKVLPPDFNMDLLKLLKDYIFILN